MDLNICILSSDNKYLKIDNIKKKYSLNLIGDVLSEIYKYQKETEINTKMLSYLLLLYFCSDSTNLNAIFV